MRITAEGRMASMLSSKRSVKSNPPRQSAACGPNVSSILEQYADDRVAILAGFSPLEESLLMISVTV